MDFTVSQSIPDCVYKPYPAAYSCRSIHCAQLAEDSPKQIMLVM